MYSEEQKKKIDNIFDGFNVACIFIYLIEIFLQGQADRDRSEQEDPDSPFYWRYKFSLYFWLDLLSTLTMILDLSWILNTMFPINLNQPKTIQKKITVISQVVRAVRIGSRVGRLVRITRFFRTERLYLPLNRINSMML